MPERLEKLKATLAELEAELAAVDEIDGDTRALLEEAQRDIEAKLQAEVHPDQWEPHSLIERVQEAEHSFQISHPTIAGILSRMVDGLRQLGI